jgi:transposase
MSKSTHQSYTAEFRELAVKQAIESNKAVTATAKELDVKVNTLQTWIFKYSGVQTEKIMCTDEDLYDKLKRLKKEVARLTEERDILKKAAAYFVRNHQ